MLHSSEKVPVNSISKGIGETWFCSDITVTMQSNDSSDKADAPVL